MAGSDASRSESFDVRAATPDDRADILSLLRRSLGGDGDDERFAQLFSWKHDRNPFGPSPMWVATDRGQIVAFRTFMRWEFVRGGEVLHAVRAVDTATDPDYQGRGLFRTLTMHALEEVRAEGVDFVFNTPNSQSRPGYLKMGWREVGRLPAAVRLIGISGGLRALRSKVPADRWSQDLSVGVPFDEWIRGAGVAGRRLRREPHPAELRTNADVSYLTLAVRRAIPEVPGRRRRSDGDRGTSTPSRRSVGAGCRRCLRSSPTRLIGSRRGPHVRLELTTRSGSGGARIRSGYVPLPRGGPTLTWRSVNDAGMPPLSNWKLSLGDIELF